MAHFKHCDLQIAKGWKRLLPPRNDLWFLSSFLTLNTIIVFSTAQNKVQIGNPQCNFMYKLSTTAFFGSDDSTFIHTFTQACFILLLTSRTSEMASSTTLLRLLVILLGISLLICANAVPVTRIGGLNKHIGPEVHQPVAENNKPMMTTEMRFSERMDVELNDYPGSGANNRHTPKPQYARCVDC